MATIRTDIPVGTTQANAWDALRDYGAVHERVAPGFVTDTRMDGDDRMVTGYRHYHEDRLRRPDRFPQRRRTRHI